jgi:hypothetical protein
MSEMEAEVELPGSDPLSHPLGVEGAAEVAAAEQSTNN